MVDIIVIGGGHAGIEAALAASRMGMETVLFTMHIDMIGSMPCNPSVGGPAKGIVVREIDALGGEMGRAADATALQFKMLNTTKGPGVQSLRVQSDKIAYRKYMQDVLLHQGRGAGHVGGGGQVHTARKLDDEYKEDEQPGLEPPRYPGGYVGDVKGALGSVPVCHGVST